MKVLVFLACILVAFVAVDAEQHVLQAMSAPLAYHSGACNNVQGTCLDYMISNRCFNGFVPKTATTDACRGVKTTLMCCPFSITSGAVSIPNGRPPAPEDDDSTIPEFDTDFSAPDAWLPPQLNAAPPQSPSCPSTLSGDCGSAAKSTPPGTFALKSVLKWSALTSKQQDNVRLLMNEANRQGVTGPSAKAYILATALWESSLSPIEEVGGSVMRYAPYYGRGFVQLTWRANYVKFTNLLKSQRGITANLVANPRLALNPTYAAFIAVWGMRTGAFTGVSLSDYINTKKVDFYNARRIINGLDKASTIEKLAKLWMRLTPKL